jgi:hypothetical protein
LSPGVPIQAQRPDAKEKQETVWDKSTVRSTLIKTHPWVLPVGSYPLGAGPRMNPILSKKVIIQEVEK